MRWLLDDAVYKYEARLDPDRQQLTSTFLLTRFNVPLPGAREKGGLHSEERFRAWCINRSSIFNRVCLPSVLGQITKPAGWLILFDERYLEETESATKSISRFDWIVPIVVREHEMALPFRRFYTPEICKRLPTNARLVATCRLDNDDAIARSYVHSIMEYSNSLMSTSSSIPTWLSFPFGAQWDGSEVSLLIMNNNPFLSLVENTTAFMTGKATTAMSVNHGHVYERGNVLTPLSRYPMWLQYTHDDNVSNKKNAWLLKFRDPQQALREFSIASI